ncbi:hypothetical protein GE061_013935 [Apolygus lucorum]|uniref:Salivary secreted peptide n=1 Tax=Apolygus lucorum TaxID=248454 RepID=A0A8S9XQC4_APOLU|nr:hypothetical protein GE061_013935 [Apolygus lucorum]
MAMERLVVAVTSGLLLAVLLATLAPSPALAVDCGTNKSHNSFIGSKHYNDNLLYMNHVKEKGIVLWELNTDVATGNVGGVINYIEVLDQKTDGTGGCFYLKSGGVGTSKAEFHFKSQRNKGLDFIIKVYGRSY